MYFRPLDQSDASEVLLENSESSHEEIANIKNNSCSSNNPMTNSSHTTDISNNITVRNTTNINKNLHSNIIEILLKVMIVVSFPPLRVTATQKSLETQRSPKSFKDTVDVEIGSASDTLFLFNKGPCTTGPPCELVKRKSLLLPFAKTKRPIRVQLLQGNGAMTLR
ncbi:hypothetical protein Zmor_012412 [Zophobas morio]|uniref:Uncharacterized protein n=1 Tax=Zophobas morio TaxID=2755281 RepID=A0AA38LXU0_9CUCU|nr:hypothetical protein Zmor_012412 [Zophobas morio]